MVKIRVLVVDDSVVIRRLLTDILSQDPDIEVVGTAPNGRIALSKLTQVNPDLVTLDIEMPELDGLETLPELRKIAPRLPVIMFSTLTERGAGATLEALARGATDYVTKPANVGSVSAGAQSVREQLIPRIKSLCGKPLAAPARPLALPKAASHPIARRAAGAKPEVVVIGASTGGPQALQVLLERIPASFPLPMVIVQHMPPVFTRYLAGRLDQYCALSVAEAAAGDILRRGQVLVAPGNFHLELQRSGARVVVQLQQGPPENSCRPAVDVLFRSAAQVYGPRCLAVVLTGMGQDGARGSEHIVRAGGTVLAQDEPTSIVWGMPRAVVEAGLADCVLPLAALADELLQRVQHTNRLAASH